MSYDENRISDQIDGGLQLKKGIEKLALECFAFQKNKAGEKMTPPIGASPKGWRKHLNSFTKGYLAALKTHTVYVNDPCNPDGVSFPNRWQND